MRKFTYKELAMIASNQFSTYELASRLNTSEDIIRWAIEDYEIDFSVQRYKYWTEHEDNIIRQMRASRESVPDIAKALKRPASVVHVRIKHLNIPRIDQIPWTEEEDNYLLLARTMGKSFAAIGKHLKRSKNSTCGRYYRIMED